MTSQSLHHIRQEYCQQSLSKEHCQTDPLQQFLTWLNEAISAKVNEPSAMNLATVNETGAPTSRIVLLKEVNDQGFVFFSNYESQKGRNLQHNPKAALLFFWPELERQVRIEGEVTQLPAAESDAYFQSRPYASRIGAWASAQSRAIDSRKSLIAAAAKVAAIHPFHIPRPPHWGGYLLTPQRLEFWQGRPSRLHDRILYTLADEGWDITRLQP